MKTTIKIFILISIFFSAAIYAGDWSGDGDLGYNSVSGNSESDSLAVGLSATYEASEKWKHMGEFDAFSASQDDETTAKTYSLKLQSDYNINEKSFAFGNMRYLDDRFSGYDYQSSFAIGLGRTFIDDGIQLFSAQAGAGYRKSELADNLGDESEAIFTSQLIYNQTITDTTQFESTWIAEAGKENTYLEGSLALIVSMTDALGLKIAYLAKHNTDVPAGTKKTDRYTTVSLNYAFD